MKKLRVSSKFISVARAILISCVLCQITPLRGSEDKPNDKGQNQDEDLEKYEKKEILMMTRPNSLIFTFLANNGEVISNIQIPYEVFFLIIDRFPKLSSFSLSRLVSRDWNHTIRVYFAYYFARWKLTIPISTANTTRLISNLLRICPGLGGLVVHVSNIQESLSLSGFSQLTELQLTSDDVRASIDLPLSIENLRLRLNDLSFVNLTLLPGLIVLNLRGSGLTEVPNSILEMTRLTALNLQGNQLQAVSNIISALTGLIALNLRGNLLSALPDSLSALTGLIVLHLNHNQLTQVPNIISELTRLAVLNLNSNALSKLPDGLSALTGLTELNLHHNQLTEFPSGISSLIRLTDLYLSFNQLTQVPNGISALTHLTYLGLSNNQLIQVPNGISALTHLADLGLDNNQLTGVNVQALNSLEWLELGANSIRSLGDIIGLSALINLEALQLSDNPLEGNDNILPTTLTNLKELFVQRILVPILVMNLDLTRLRVLEN